MNTKEYKQLATEDEECIIFVNFLLDCMQKGLILNFSHISNETYTKFWTVKIKNKKMGVRQGIPDYVIITTKNVLFIEMKRKKGGVVSKTQMEWIEQLGSVNIPAYVAYGADEAMEIVGRYL